MKRATFSRTSCMRSAWCGVACLLCVLMSAAVHATPGSWVNQSTGVTLFTPERIVESKPLHPVGKVPDEARIRRVSWRYQAVGGQPQPHAWLCHPQRCIALTMARGSSKALAGLGADTPLHFRFRLPAARRLAQPQPPQRVKGLQVIVDYD